MKISKLLKVALCSIFYLSTLVGCSGESPYKKAEPQTIEYNGTNISIEPDEDMTEGDVKTAIKLIESQPSYLLKNCTTVHWQGNDIFVQAAMNNGTDEAKAKEIAGFQSETEIFLNGRNKFEGAIQISDESRSRTITHELWHLYDWKNGNGYQYASETQLLELYNQNPKSLAGYGATNSDENTLEFFAEGGAMYIHSPEELKERNIDLYNYFESLPKE